VNYPGHHEGIVGEDLPDAGWLSLEETNRQTKRLLSLLLHESYGALLSVNGDGWRRMSRPEVGDLVVESSGFWPRRGWETECKSLGILLAQREEWVHTDQQWDEVKGDWEGDPRPHEPVFYVQYGQSANDVCRWANASFIGVSRESVFVRDPR
jgi:hypothetical protein